MGALRRRALLQNSGSILGPLILGNSHIKLLYPGNRRCSILSVAVLSQTTTHAHPRVHTHYSKVPIGIHAHNANLNNDRFHFQVYLNIKTQRFQVCAPHFGPYLFLPRLVGV